MRRLQDVHRESERNAFHELPANPFPGAIAKETNETVLLALVQAADGEVQSVLGVLLRQRRQRVVNATRPALS